MFNHFSYEIKPVLRASHIGRLAKNTIRDGGSIALYADYTVYTVYTDYTVYSVYTVDTVDTD